LRPWFAGLKRELLEKRLESYRTEQRRLSDRIRSTEADQTSLEEQRVQYREQLAAQGGGQIERLKSEITQQEVARNERQRRDKEYRLLAERLSFAPPDTLPQFQANRETAEQHCTYYEARNAQNQNQLTEAEVDLRTAREQRTEIVREVESLAKRRSNIDDRQIQIRRQLCLELQLPEEEFPFAGELLRVRPDSLVWEGATERLLHGFGLALLVPEAHYSRVCDWVDRIRLRGRLVYYRIPGKIPKTTSSLHPDSLVRKVEIRPDTEFYGWLEHELHKRFDYVCCDIVEQFRREKQAITIQGQVKSGEHRHENDDRHAIDDRSHYVLGWDNLQKLALLQAQQAEIEETIRNMAERKSKLERVSQELVKHDRRVRQLLQVRTFEELDWHSVVQQVDVLQERLRALENASDGLRVLCEQLQEIEAQLKQVRQRLDGLKHEFSQRGQRQADAERLRDDCAHEHGEVDPAQLQPQEEPLRRRLGEVQGDDQLTVESSDRLQKELREALQGEIDAEEKRCKALSEKIVKAMEGFRRDYPAETAEMDATVAAGPEFRKLLDKLCADDLPAYELRFRKLLQENAIREVLRFRTGLEKQEHEIRDRIAKINGSLAEIEYNPGRYIALEAGQSADGDIREFQRELRACLDDSLTGGQDGHYAERKFLQVKAILERFRGRPGLSELDAKWSAKVADVRNWFVFAASERWKEDHQEYEHYTDSGGKSGGQKEKLAYTVLAASLAYQFGLEWGAVRSRSFRFVVIDEAFGRGSDESARFGLELFRRLNLQLLIVTPLQKIHVIEPYVASVGFVANRDGRESLLRNLTIEEYRSEKSLAAGGGQ
jgi:uncharacterized protein YPO0396